MALQREDDLAWRLVEEHRDLLTAEECTAVFVDLGIGEYLAAIRRVLKSVGAQGRTLSAASASAVRAWIDCYDADAEFVELLEGARR